VPDPPPVPVVAHFGAPYATVEFDRRLTGGPISTGNWFVRVANLQKNITNVDVEGHVPRLVDVLCSVGGIPNAGPDVVSYSPPPFDLTSLTGIPAAAFADFPIT